MGLFRCTTMTITKSAVARRNVKSMETKELIKESWSSLIMFNQLINVLFDPCIFESLSSFWIESVGPFFILLKKILLPSRTHSFLYTEELTLPIPLFSHLSDIIMTKLKASIRCFKEVEKLQCSVEEVMQVCVWV